jgi:hypothetical protein
VAEVTVSSYICADMDVRRSVTAKLSALALSGLLGAGIAIGCGGSSGSSNGGSFNSNTTTTLSPANGSTLPSGTVATVYTQTITILASAGSAPFTFTPVQLPPGLILQQIPPAAAALKGTPTQAGTSEVTFQIVDSTNSNVTNASYGLTIK